VSDRNGNRAVHGGQDGRALPRSAGRDPFQRESELADAVLRLLVAHSRYGVSTDAGRIALVAHITVLLAHKIAKRVEQLRGQDAARAFRRALARREPN
jgi:hypothetical protein